MDVAADDSGDEGDDGDEEEGEGEDSISAILDSTGGKMSPRVHHFTPIQTLLKLALLLLGFLVAQQVKNLPAMRETWV